MLNYIDKSIFVDPFTCDLPKCRIKEANSRQQSCKGEGMDIYDVAIIGAGVCGCTLARELARKKLAITVFESCSDVACGASKANSGIVHAGYDAKPGTLKAKYNVLGNPLFEQLSVELDFPFKRIGSLVLAFSQEERAGLETLYAKGLANSVGELSILDKADVFALEPYLNQAVQAALLARTGGIVCPYEMTIAFAENAAANGVAFQLDNRVVDIKKEKELFIVDAVRSRAAARAVVNAAGIYSDMINSMLSEDSFAITPRRGEYLLLDQTEKDLVKHTLFQLPGPMGKGVLLTPTVDGNILAGPTSENIEDKSDTATTAAGLERIVAQAVRDVANFPSGKIITSFAGLRAHSSRDDFIIGESPDTPLFFNLAGIESPGLTSAPAIARDMAALIGEKLSAKENPHFQPLRKAPLRFRHLTNEERQAAIRDNPDYGHIVCRCEKVSKAEVVAALRSPLAALRDLDAVKRRTRAGMGRCQGGFCSMRLPEIIAETASIAMENVSKMGGESNVLFYPDKTGVQD